MFGEPGVSGGAGPQKNDSSIKIKLNNPLQTQNLPFNSTFRKTPLKHIAMAISAVHQSTVLDLRIIGIWAIA